MESRGYQSQAREAIGLKKQCESVHVSAAGGVLMVMGMTIAVRGGRCPRAGWTQVGDAGPQGRSIPGVQAVATPFFS